MGRPYPFDADSGNKLQQFFEKQIKESKDKGEKMLKS